MARKPKRRTRSPHPGVVLIAPKEAARHDYWRARFRDPDTERFTFVRLDPTALPNEAKRRDWAIRKSAAIAKRKMDLASGAPRFTGTGFGEAVEKYFKAPGDLRERTLAGYRQVGDKLKEWASKNGVKTSDDLTLPRLNAFRKALIAERRRVPVKDGERGEWKPGSEKRSPHTINRELRAARTILGDLRSIGQLPLISGDDLRAGLKRVDAPLDVVDFLSAADIRRLLEAAIRHDADCHEVTRNENAGRRPKGSTPKHSPIAPFLGTVLLTGMRVGEVVTLEWKHVDLKAIDSDGKEVGIITLEGKNTKTNKGRRIDLSVSPSLHTMLKRMKLKSGGKGSVFGLTRPEVDATAKRLRGDVERKGRSKKAKERLKAKEFAGYGAPESFSWQALRRTCAVYLTNAPAIYGSASAFRSAKRLGHGVQVAERHYLEDLHGIPRDARTLEAAMQCADLMEAIAAGRGPKQQSALVRHAS